MSSVEERWPLHLVGPSCKGYPSKTPYLSLSPLDPLLRPRRRSTELLESVQRTGETQSWKCRGFTLRLLEIISQWLTEGSLLVTVNQLRCGSTDSLDKDWVRWYVQHFGLPSNSWFKFFRQNVLKGASSRMSDRESGICGIKTYVHSQYPCLFLPSVSVGPLLTTVNHWPSHTLYVCLFSSFSRGFQHGYGIKGCGASCRPRRRKPEETDHLTQITDVSDVAGFDYFLKDLTGDPGEDTLPWLWWDTETGPRHTPFVTDDTPGTLRYFPRRVCRGWVSSVWWECLFVGETVSKVEEGFV